MPEPGIAQDMHVHSTFSDGKNSIEENVAEAERIGLKQLTCVDHVRADTKWVPDYVAAVREAGERASIDLYCAVEAKILDTDGRLDLPAGLEGVDAIYAADHQVPSPRGPMHPRSVGERIEAQELDPETVLMWIVAATAAAVRHYDGVVIAHLFSVLPKIGLGEEDVSPELVESLAKTTADAGARIEVDERWKCPSAATLRPFVEHGVPLLMSTDSHRSKTIGRFDYCTGVLRELQDHGPAATA